MERTHTARSGGRMPWCSSPGLRDLENGRLKSRDPQLVCARAASWSWSYVCCIIRGQGKRSRALNHIAWGLIPQINPEQGMRPLFPAVSGLIVFDKLTSYYGSMCSAGSVQTTYRSQTARRTTFPRGPRCSTLAELKALVSGLAE